MTNSEFIALDSAKNYIYSIDFTPIINKLVKHLGWRLIEAEKTCQLYRNFLFLQKKYGNDGSLPPSEEIDEFWHNHILDTAKYREDCQKIFGKYLDHYPYFGIDGKSDAQDLHLAFEVTQQLHHKEFGYQIQRIKKLKTKEMFSIVIEALKETFRK